MPSFGAVRAALTVPLSLRHLGWSRGRLSAHQLQRLRRLVGVARASSPWHRRRLRGIDPATMTLEDLERLPIMTKDDVMDAFDEIVTDRRLTFEAARRHLEGAEPGEPLLGEYQIVTSAGSTGRVGIWPFDKAAWAAVHATNMRMLLRAMLRDGPSLHRPVTAVIGAAHTTHISAQIVRDLAKTGRLHELPVTLPFDAIVDGLQKLQPEILAGYPSMLTEIALAQRQGRLEIAPKRVACSAEPLPGEQRALMEQVWKVQVANVWATSEAGPIATGDYERPNMFLNEDQVICEPVDARGRPVETGQTAAHVYVTSLFNHALPLIRYVLSDTITPLAPLRRAEIVFRRIADIDGRFDEMFVYSNGARAHTHIFRSALSHATNMIDYQVIQTPGGVSIRVRATGELDTEAMARRVHDQLRAIGLPHPEVDVRLVSWLPRSPSGKIQRNVPLSTNADSLLASHR